MRTAILILVCLAVANAVPSNPQRIVGGYPTAIGAYPYSVSLLYSPNLVTYTQFCGGTIINNRSVLSAAHCFFGDIAAQWRARVGSTFANSGGTVHNAASLILHPNYNSNTYNNDVAILRTATNIVYAYNVRAGSIAGASYNLGDNQVVWAIGWGATSQGGSASEQLRHVQVWTVNQTVCRQRYGTAAITDQMLCSGWLDVGGRDQCQGDSGGPLIHNNVIVGVCSWGYGCANAYYPGVNARVSVFANWIVDNA